MKRWALIFAFFVVQDTLWASLDPGPSEARSREMVGRPCVALTQENVPPLFSETIGIVFGSDVPAAMVNRAVAEWARCDGYRTDFPRLLVGHRGTQTVEVRFDRTHRRQSRCGSFVGHTIVLYAFTTDERGRTHYCGSRVDGLVHELGHLLGLLDAPDDPGCRDHAMSAIDTRARDRREIQPEECRAIGRRWLTPRELAADSEAVLAAASAGGR